MAVSQLRTVPNKAMSGIRCRRETLNHGFMASISLPPALSELVMLWPLVLPFKITFWSLIAIVAVVTTFAPQFNWKRTKMFLISSTLAMLAFIPSCTAIMVLIDDARFGYFEYPTRDHVQDFRAKRYLPTADTRIKMHKHTNGYRAQYRITDADFHAYLDGLWTQYGDY